MADKPRWDNSDAFFKKGYDSDKDLSDDERKKIARSRNPRKERKKIWEKKGAWDKTKKMMKSAWYGDKQDD